jgi:hypothetical protein
MQGGARPGSGREKIARNFFVTPARSSAYFEKGANCRIKDLTLSFVVGGLRSFAGL